MMPECRAGLGATVVVLLLVVLLVLVVVVVELVVVVLLVLLVLLVLVVLVISPWAMAWRFTGLGNALLGSVCSCLTSEPNREASHCPTGRGEFHRAATKKASRQARKSTVSQMKRRK